MNSIIAYHSTKFGELWESSLDDLMKNAVSKVLEKSNLEFSHIDAIFVGNMLGGIVEGKLLLEAHISELFDIHIPIYRIEAACASGGMAFQMADQYLCANPNKTRRREAPQT